MWEVLPESSMREDALVSVLISLCRLGAMGSSSHARGGILPLLGETGP